jgi:hypothetical protein
LLCYKRIRVVNHSEYCTLLIIIPTHKIWFTWVCLQCHQQLTSYCNSVSFIHKGIWKCCEVITNLKITKQTVLERLNADTVKNKAKSQTASRMSCQMSISLSYQRCQIISYFYFRHHSLFRNYPSYMDHDGLYLYLIPDICLHAFFYILYKIMVLLRTKILITYLTARFFY